MSNTKHTTGPWLHDVMNDCTFMVREPGVLDHAIAHVDNVANARLIAAAPDLLEALRGCLNALEIAFERCEGDLLGKHHNDGIDAMIAAGAALAKAGAL